MKLSSIERKILWAAIEDYAGLWELVWELATSCPEIAEPERRKAAQRVVRDLLERSCIELYVRPKIEAKENFVPKARWQELLSDEKNWNEPSVESRAVLIGATNTGKKLYNADADD